MKADWRTIDRSGWWREATASDAVALPTQPIATPLALSRRHRWPTLIGLLLALFTAIILGVAWGSVGIPVVTILEMLAVKLRLLPATAATWPHAWETIIFTIRLPRVVLAGLVGAALALSGATYQGLFRNPLADPYLIGVASGAALGATLAVVLRLPARLGWLGATQWCAFIGALLAVVTVYSLARVGGTTPLTTLLLAGVAISALASGLTSFLMYWYGDKLLTIYGWLLGGFAIASWQQVGLVAPYLALGSLLLLPAARLLDALQLGEEEAAALGIAVEPVKLLLVIVATLLTAAAVSVSGLIAFVGLIVPHCVRLLWGSDHRTLLPASLLGGAIFLIATDGLARTMIAPAELPVGILTSLCGAPFFIFLLRRARRAIF